MSAYEEGKKAFEYNLPRFVNPYYDQNLYYDWENGWLDAYYSYYGYD